VKLTEILVKENPEDDIAKLQLAGEYFANGQYKEAKQAAFLYLSAAGSFPLEQGDEVVGAWLLIADCEDRLGNPHGSLQAALFATAIEPSHRESWVHLAYKTFNMGLMPLAFGASSFALNLTQPLEGYSVETFCWGPFPEEVKTAALNNVLMQETAC
jgi:hypothetical protein